MHNAKSNQFYILLFSCGAKCRVDANGEAIHYLNLNHNHGILDQKKTRKIKAKQKILGFELKREIIVSPLELVEVVQ